MNNKIIESRKLKLMLSIIFILTLSIITISFKVHAETLNNKQKISFDQLVGVKVEPVIPKNQIDSSIPYFYLKENANSSDTIKIKIINTSQKDKEVTVELNNASTNRNGLIVYETAEYNKDYLKAPITNLAKVEQTDVTVPANSTKLVDIKINTPSEVFNGISLGGIVVKEKINDEKVEGIKNIYSYTIGLVLTEEEKPQLYGHTDLKLISVKPVLSNGYKFIEADILNPYPEIFNKILIQGKIYNDKGNEILKNEIKESSIAPQTFLPFSFDLGKEEMKPGEYTFEGTAYSEGNEWKFKQNFTILPEEAKEINEKSINKYVLPWFIYYLIAILLIVSVISIIFNFIRIKKRKDEK